jgi:hypothetical protein
MCHYATKQDVTTVGTTLLIKRQLSQTYQSHISPVSKCGIIYNSVELASVQM